MNTSKIKAIVQSKQSPKNNKRYTILELEDWIKWTISHDTEDQYKVWQELKYKTTPTQDDPSKFWISEVKENKKGFPQRNYNAEFAMKALEYASRSWVQNIYELADKYFDRLKKKSLSYNQTNND